MNNTNSIVYNSKPIEIADDGVCKYATFLISVLDEYDRMNRKIPLASGEKYHDTLRGFPIVAKLMKDRSNRPVDYGAHEMRQWKRRNGDVETTFGTYPIGSVIDTWIEDRVVDGYGEEAKPCLMARAKLWTCRSPEYFTVFDKLWRENKISSSWEMITSDVEEEASGKRILKAFSFIGNALLGTTSVPAVGGAGVYEYAEVTDECNCEDSEELSIALLKDIENFKEQEDNSLTDEVKENEKQEEVVDETTASESKDTETPVEEIKEPESTEANEAGDSGEQTEEAQCNVNKDEEDKLKEKAECNPDKKEKDEEAECNAKKEKKTAEDPMGDEPVSLDAPAESEPCDLGVKVEELSNALIQANDMIQELKAEIESLAPFKAQVEKIEQEKAEAEKANAIKELKNTAISSGWISEKEINEDESIASMIANVDVNGINAMIVKRLTASLNAGKKYHIASSTNKTFKADISAEEPTISSCNIVSAFIKQ